MVSTNVTSSDYSARQEDGNSEHFGDQTPHPQRIHINTKSNPSEYSENAVPSTMGALGSVKNTPVTTARGACNVAAFPEG